MATKSQTRRRIQWRKIGPPILLISPSVILVGTLVLGFIWAWILERPIKGEGFFRSIFLFPMAVSFIASGVVWKWLLNSGVDDNAKGLNRLFQMLGLDFLQNSWTANITFGVVAVAIPAIWQLLRVCHGPVLGWIPRHPR